MAIDVPVTRSKNRNRLHVIAAILNITKPPGARKTRIMYGANLSYAMTERYLGTLCDGGLLKKDISDDKIVYRTTSKGMKFLDLFQEISRFDLFEDELETGTRSKHSAPVISS